MIPAARIASLTRRERALALRALGWLLLAAATLRLLPYSTVRRAIDRIPPRFVAASPLTPLECERALCRAARVLPGASCLARAIAAACLLRRDGLDSTLTIGVRFDSDHRLGAHAWLESDCVMVTGRPGDAGHRVLLRDVIYQSDSRRRGV